MRKHQSKKKFSGPKGKRDFTDHKRSFSEKAKVPPKKDAGRETKKHSPKSAFQRKGVLLWGIHAVREALLNSNRNCFTLLATEAGYAGVEKTLLKLKEKKQRVPEIKTVERTELDNILPSGSVHQGVVLDASPLEEVDISDIVQENSGIDIVVVLDQVTDPHNIGAILRSAAAFGAKAVIMTERNAPTTTGVMAKTASGALEHVALVHVVNLARALSELRQSGYWCVGLAEETDKDLSKIDLSGKTAIVMGAEGDGLRRLTRENCDELARLPTGGPIGSLNVSNAAAVALYEIRRQR